MWPFNRNKQEQTNVPQEVQDYYQSERRERTGMAWLLALGTLLVTIAIAIGLFFAGRWAYRQVFGTNDTSTGVVENGGAQDEGATESDNDLDVEIGGDNPANQPVQGNDTDDGGNAAGDNGGQNGDENGTVNGDSDESGKDREDIPSTGPEALPDTGAGGVLVLFAATSAAGTLAHRIYTRRD